MAQSKSRRSFLGELLQSLASGWLALTALPAMLSGCKTEGPGPIALHPPQSDGGPAADPGPGAVLQNPAESPTVSKYGVRIPQPSEEPKVGVPTPAYGVNPEPEPRPKPDYGAARPKYGVDETEMNPPKYGVENPPVKLAKYGVRPPDNLAKPRYGVRPIGK